MLAGIFSTNSPFFSPLRTRRVRRVSRSLLALGGRGEDCGETSGEEGADLRGHRDGGENVNFRLNKSFFFKYIARRISISILCDSQCEVFGFLSHDTDSALFGKDRRVLVTDPLVEQHVGIPVPPPHVWVRVGYKRFEHKHATLCVREVIPQIPLLNAGCLDSG